MKSTNAVVRPVQVTLSMLFAAIVSIGWVGHASAAGPPEPGLDVNVTNTVSTRGADNPAFQPFQHEGSINFGPGLVGSEATFTVPNGKRLVIEFASFWLLLPTGQKPTSNWVGVVNSAVSSNHLKHFVPLVFQGTSVFGGQNSDSFVGSSPVRLYADPGTTVELVVRSTGVGAGNGSAFVSISGYLVDVP